MLWRVCWRDFKGEGKEKAGERESEREREESQPWRQIHKIKRQTWCLCTREHITRNYGNPQNVPYSEVIKMI